MKAMQEQVNEMKLKMIRNWGGASAFSWGELSKYKFTWGDVKKYDTHN